MKKSLKIRPSVVRSTISSADPEQAGEVRRVCNAASKFGGVSLNDNLIGVPDLLQSLKGNIFRFREKQIALTADVEAMFLQVKELLLIAKCSDFCGEEKTLNLYLCMNMEDTFSELRVRQHVSTMLYNKSDETAEMKMEWLQIRSTGTSKWTFL